MGERFRDKVVMITGAAGGFGSEAARQFAAEGAKLLLSDRSAEALDGLVGELGGRDRVFATAVDVTDEDGVCDHVTEGTKALGGLHVAINNAGIGHDLAPLHKLSGDTFDRMMAVNAKGVFLCMKAQILVMLEAGSGAILNVASAAGLVGAGHLSAYAASKHAVVGLTRAAADEVARKGIRVNALCPSFALTPLFGDIADALADRRGESRETAHSRITGRVPMGRVASPAEVVQAMLWITHADNSFMTGQAIAVDGGLTAV